MTVVTNIILPEKDVLTAIHHAQIVAKRNRCKSWNKHVTVVTGDHYDLKLYGHPRIKEPTAEFLGLCWNQHHTERYIYIKPDRGYVETVHTLCHELAHAFTNPNAKHSYSWRSLYLLYFATLTRIFGLKNTEYEFIDEIRYIRTRYEPRGYTPYERHLNAMLKMREWYIKELEGQ